MAKPICVIYYLEQIFTGRLDSVYEVNKMFKEYLPDYHTLAIPSRLSADGSCEDLRLEVFHEKDFTEIQYEELKQIVLNSIENEKERTTLPQ